MEETWHSQGLYNNYYPQDSRPSPDGTITSPIDDEHDVGHRRSPTGGFLPPPPPHTATAGPHSPMNLPPFNQAFYYQDHPGPMSHYPDQGYGDGNSQGYYHNDPSPVMTGHPLPPSHAHRAPPPHSYDQSPKVNAGYSSDGIHHVTSPTTHLAAPATGISTSSVASTSAYPPTRNKGRPSSPKKKRRSGRSTVSQDSWDERYGEMGGDGRDGQEPWGMPQDEYRALNPRDKKQVRNRIGARRFRAKRKDYVSNLETNLHNHQDEINRLRLIVDNHRHEINDLRARLGIAALPPPDLALGLVITRAGDESESPSG